MTVTFSLNLDQAGSYEFMLYSLWLFYPDASMMMGGC